METPPRSSKIQIPERAHPLARFCFAEMKRQAITYDEVEYRSGVLRSSIKAWRRNNRPGLDSIEAVLGSLGWSLVPAPKADVIPAALRADLEAVARKHSLETLPALELIAGCVGYGWRHTLADRAEARQKRADAGREHSPSLLDARERNAS